ncbi:hypothetical protein [Arthrobacter sp. ERGS1:01]|uniref:hypothetical protein n=1 Tax=Arthrobacter sp. ERGS1:01 TaxID=1704044 RepID=UPI0012378974|nr:hypothetical protein [Arthrobacter sp. ERGS1:01]
MSRTLRPAHRRLRTSGPGSTTAAKVLSATAAIALGFAGLAALIAVPASAAPGATKVTICHADANVKKPYGPGPITVDSNSFKKNGGGPAGHATHTGPVFAPSMTSGWGDIIPPNPDLPAGLNWTAAGQAIYNNGCSVPNNSAVLGLPTVGQASCAPDGSLIPAKLTLPATTASVSYTQSTQAVEGTTIVITAFPAAFTTLLPSGAWKVQADGTATLTVTFSAAPSCQTPAIPVAPTAPAIVQAGCNTDGTVTTPTLTLPATTGEISYSQSQAAAIGATVVITATPAKGFALTAASGWELQDNGTAIYAAQFAAVDCPTTKPSATPTAEPTVDPTVSATPTAEPTTSATPSTTPTATTAPSETPSAEPTTSATPSTTPTVDPTATDTPSPTAATTPSADPTVSATIAVPSETPEPTVDATATATATTSETTPATTSAPSETPVPTTGTPSTTPSPTELGTEVTTTTAPATTPADTRLPIALAGSTAAATTPAAALLPLASTGNTTGWMIPGAALLLAVGGVVLWRVRRPAARH